MDTKIEAAIRDVKISDTVVEVNTVVPQEVEAKQYDINFLKTQREAILKQKQEQMDARDAEIAQIDDLLSRAQSVGILISK